MERKLNRIVAQTEEVNVEIRENQISAYDWQLNNLVCELTWWCDAFNIIFFKDEPVPVPVLTFEKARVNTLGHYRIGRNDFGVREQININRQHLQRPLWEILATLLHELTHSWEYSYLEKEERTCNWFHKKLFRDKLKSFGIECNEKGAHTSIGGDFVYHLSRHGISFHSVINLKDIFKGMIEIEPKKKKKGSSKLKKWTCGCTNIRVAIKEFQALCLKCENEFKLAEIENQET